MSRTSLAWCAAALALASPFLFPRAVSLLLAIIAAPLVPGAPLAAGILADALYLPAGRALPLYTLLGAAFTAAVLFVRSRFAPGIME